MPTGLSSEKAEDGVQLSATKVTVTGAFDAQQNAFLCTMKQEFNSGEEAIPKGAFRCEVVSKPWISSLQVESEEKMITMARSTKRSPVIKLPGGDDDWYVQTGPLSTDTNYSVELIYTQPVVSASGAFDVTLPTAMAKPSATASLVLSLTAPAGWYLAAASHGQATTSGTVEAAISENLGENLVLSFTTQAPAAPAPEAAPEPAAEEAAEPAPAAEAKEAPAPAEAEKVNAEEPAAEEPKAEEPKAEEPKTEEPKAEELKAEEPKAEEPKAEEPKAEEPKAEEPKAEEPKAAEPKAEEVKAEEAKAEAESEEAKAEEAAKQAAPAAKEPERYNKDKADEYVPPNDDDDEEGEEDYSEDDEEESEEEEEATGKYSIDFLMGFREANTQRPDDMPPDLDIILGNDPQGRGGKGGDRRRRKNRRQGGGGRNGRRDSNDKRDKDSSGPSMLKQSENGWKRPDRNQEGEEAAREEALRKANGILNRLTYENYESLTKQLEEIAFKDVLVMTGVISLIFDKALSGQKFSKIYAELCDQFNKNAPVLKLDGNDVSFLKLLLNKCQEEFENKPLTESVKLQYGDLSDYEIEVKMKARLLSNIKFIGELFLLKMLPTIIVKECVVRLFGDVKEIPPEDDLESLCKLLMTTGKTLEKVEPDFSRVVFEERFRSLLDRKDIEPRCKFMIMDLLDLRHNRWVPKRKELVPTTIKEVHAAAKKDEMQQKQKSLTRSADNVGRRGDGGGRGGDEWGNRRGGGRDRDRGFNGKKGGKFGNRRDSESRGGDKHQKGNRRPSLTASASNSSNSNAGGDSGWETVGGNKNQRSGNQKQRGGQGNSGAPGWKSQSDNHVQNREGNDRGGGKSRNAFTALKQAADERNAEKKGTPPRGGVMSRLLKRSGGGFKARPRSEAREEEEEEQERPQNNFSPEEISRKIDSIIEEFEDLRDPEEAMECMKELCSPESHYKLVEHGLRTITKAVKIAVVEELVKSMFEKKMLTTDDIVKGISAVVDSLDDIVDDVPLAPAFFGTVTGHMVNDGLLPLILVKEPLQTIVDSGMAAQMLCTTLTSMMEKNDAARMQQHLTKAGISFAAYAPEKKREDPEALKALVKDDALKAILFEE